MASSRPTVAPTGLGQWLQYIDAVHPTEIEMGLGRTRRVAARLDALHPGATNVIIAGTNGKGSTTVALEQLLLAAGLQVGATLSPHIDRYNERFRLNGRELSDGRICELLQRVDAARGELSLTYFEYSALAALLAFKEAQVDVAILEIGLGGRLDAFNVVDAELAVVTSIGRDHESYLGTDLEQIGREKAGVFRPGQKVILGAVTQSVKDAARESGCQVLLAGHDFQTGESSASWSYRSDSLGLSFPELKRGPLAPTNCALAITAAASLAEIAELQPECLAAACLPGRGEVFALGESAQGADWRTPVDVIVDVAHNPAGAVFLAEQLALRYPGRRYVAILGSLADKDTSGVKRVLDPLVKSWLTLSTDGARGQSGRELAESLGLSAQVAQQSSQQALDTALSLTEPGDGILIVGSFSAVQQARTLLIECSEKCGKLEPDG
jgi:dihydrofolate synthase/folylpolyglutamate synthase